MSEDKPSEKLQELLSTCYGDIVQYATEERLPTAEKSFYSTRDYALGDTVSCSGDAALENCEQIRSCYPVGVPKSVFDNLKKVKAEIVRMEKARRPGFLRGLIVPAVLIALVGFAIYHLLHLR